MRKDWTFLTPRHQVSVPLCDSVVQAEERRTPDVEVVVDTKDAYWIDVDTDIFH